MLTITKLGTATAREYFTKEFANASNSYFSQDGALTGQWRGELAAELGLLGPATQEDYLRLVEGQDPKTGAQWIQHRETRLTQDGKEASHIPAWDLTVSAPKSFSLAALVGGDERLIAAARTSNTKAMQVMEGYVQARGGGNHLPINTGKWIVATFQHDTSRPVGGYAAPQLHFHNVLMNVQRDFTGQFRALQSSELFKAKSLGTAVFYSEISRHARNLGYEIRIDPATKAPEIKGFSREYLDAESLRRQEIVQGLERLGMSGGRAAKIVALNSRDEKLTLTPEELRAVHQAHGQLYGNQAKVAHAEALQRGPMMSQTLASPEAAVNFAERRLSERQSVFEHYEMVREALRYGRGTVSVEAIEAQISKRLNEHQLVQVHHYRDHAPGARYATPETIRMEREIIERVAEGRASVSPIAVDADLSRFPRLADNPKRQAVLRGILATSDQIVALQGTAGSAKSTAAGILRDIAEREGFRVKGLAPTGKARDSLQEKGISAETLQMHLIRARGKDQLQTDKTFYILDEASLASTKQLHTFIRTLNLQDHVLLIGDDDPNSRKVGQHTSVEAGRMFQGLQEAGMKTAHLNRIYRQKDPALKEIVLHLRYGNTEAALSLLKQQGRIREFAHRGHRFASLAAVYVQQPKGTLVVSPDNQSRHEINDAIRAKMRADGLIRSASYEFAILVPRDVAGVDRTQAQAYIPGDTIRFLRRNGELGLAAKSYAQVVDADTDRNLITVRTDAGRLVTYNPRTASGVSVYQRKFQEFAAGDRIQFTANSTKLGVSTRDVGTIVTIDENGNVKAALDKGRNVRWNLRENSHVDYAYAMTSYSAQSATVDRVLIHVDTSDFRLSGLIDKTFAYVAGSRPQLDMQVFTDDASRLQRSLSREHDRPNALSREQIREHQPAERAIA